MEQRKYTTGTKGRLKKHRDDCREFIHTHSPSFSLANEFIDSVDPDKEDKVWQRFLSPQSILPELQAWLQGDPPPEKQNILHPGVRTASQMAAEGGFSNPKCDGR
ncbi:MAG: hypothetical protein WCG66_10670 [bacterium]